MFYLNPFPTLPKDTAGSDTTNWNSHDEYTHHIPLYFTFLAGEKLCHVIQWLCPVYQLAHQPMNCFKRFENRRFGHYTMAIVLILKLQRLNSLVLHKCRIIAPNTYAASTDKCTTVAKTPWFTLCGITVICTDIIAMNQHTSHSWP